MKQLRGQSTRWRQTQEQRILQKVKQSLSDNQATEAQTNIYAFKYISTSGKPSALSPNPCRLAMSKFTSKGSALSPHEMTGKRLKNTLIEKLKSRSPHVCQFKREGCDAWQAQTIKVLPNHPKPSLSTTTKVSCLTLKDLELEAHPDPNAENGKNDEPEDVEDALEKSAIKNLTRKRQIQSVSDVSHAVLALNDLQDTIRKARATKSASEPAPPGNSKSRPLTHLSREDIEREAMRTRLLVSMGLKKERKQVPYIRLADRKPPNNASFSQDGMYVQQIMASDQIMTKKYRAEDVLYPAPQSLKEAMRVRPITPRRGLDSSKTARTSSPPITADAPLDDDQACEGMGKYIDRQSQVSLAATYRRTCALLESELCAKKRKRDELQHQLRYLQMLASLRLQPDKIPIGFYCYLNLPCCHYLIYSEMHCTIGELCLKCRNRVEKSVVVKTDMIK